MEEIMKAKISEIEQYYLYHAGTLKELSALFEVSEVEIRKIITPLKDKYRKFAVTRYLSGEKSIQQLAEDYHVREETVVRWITDPSKAPDTINKCEQNSLLLGNGLNYGLVGNVPWSDLLDAIGIALEVPYNSQNSNTLELERMANLALAQGGLYRNNKSVFSFIKGTIANVVTATELRTPNGTTPTLYEITTLPCQNYLTTNYDLLIEKVFHPDFVAEEARFTKYCFEKTSSDSNRNFYHPHGIAYSPSSICIGYEHYMGIVENLRRSYNTKDNGRLENTAILKTLRKAAPPDNQWGELFYTTNMAIIGLGLDPSEADLWWLLTHRASLYYRNVGGARYLINNTIVYYDTYDDLPKEDEKEEKNRQAKLEMKNKLHSLLPAFHICVKRVLLSDVAGDYDKAYRIMFNDIRTNGIAGPDSIVTL